jgi:3',5'-cyclic AMP phosphodiesterase CpdA
VLLTPGNHDYGNAMQVDPTVAKQFRDKFSSTIFGTQPSHFPVLHLIEDCAFIGLDSNQGEMGWLTRWFAEGNCGNQQIESLSNLLDASEVKNKFKVLYLHHHPFFDAYTVAPDVDDGHYLSHLLNWNTRRFRRLKDAYSLLQCIRDRVDAILFGHQHYGLNYSAESQRYGIPIALDGSSSTCTEMDTDRMRYRIIDTTTRAITTRVLKPPY